MKSPNCGWKHNYGPAICANMIFFYPICGWMMKFGAPFVTFYIATSTLHEKWKKQTNPGVNLSVGTACFSVWCCILMVTLA